MTKPKPNKKAQPLVKVKRARDVPLNLRVSQDEKRWALALVAYYCEESLSAYVRRLIRAEARKAKLT